MAEPTIDIPKPVASVATDKQLVTGPDGKQYSFSKNVPREKIDKYFAKKLGYKYVGGKLQTQYGENVSDLTKVGTPPKASNKTTLPGVKDSAIEGVADTLPTNLGMLGGDILGSQGAALGGIVGESLRQMIMRPILLGRGEQDLSSKQSLIKMGEEAVKQAAFQKGGEKAGEIFFKTLNKVVPHAVVKKGIPLLPGDLEPNSKVMKYVEDLLTNLAPSSKTMATFRAGQNAAIIKQTEKIAQGFARFDGTSEEMGVLLRNTMQKADQDALLSLRKQYPNLKTFAQLSKTPEGKVFFATFRNSLSRAIMATDKPEEIAGFIRGTSKGSLEDTRVVTDMLHELKPEMLGKVQNRIMRDIVNETFTGSKDPILKGSMAKGFSGKNFKGILDNVGDEKLKALYGQKGYKAITDFTQLIEHVDKTQGGGAGKFLNLLFLLPFRSMNFGRTSGLAFVVNRAAKIITSPQGVGLYENYIRATTAQTPRLANLAREELVKYNQLSDKEYEMEQKQTEEEFKKQQGENN